MTITLKERFLKYKVSASSMEDFMQRYYKSGRYFGRGDDYAASLLASHTRHFEEHGYDFISHHDSVTGYIVAFFGAE